MATFGNTNQEAYLSGGWDDGVVVGKFDLSEDGDVSKLTVYLSNNRSGHGACNVKGIIYADNSATPVGGGLMASTSAVAVADAYAGWKDLSFASPVSLSAGTYWLGVHGDASCDGLDVAVEDYEDTNARFWRVDTYSDGTADPCGSGKLNSGYRMSVYGTYTVPAVSSRYMTLQRGIW